MVSLPASFKCWTAMATGLALASCLPKDTRPEPGRLDVTVTADPRLLGGPSSLSTTDGWTLSYDRFLISLDPQLDDDSTCAPYNDGYPRIMDLEVPGPQKLNQLFALGHCDFGYRVAAGDPYPPAYLPLGKGVTAADVALMQNGALDPYIMGRESRPPVPTGVALYASGRATKDGVTKTFAWTFRQGVSYQNCAAPLAAEDGGQAPDSGGRRLAGDSSDTRDAGSRDAATADSPDAMDAGFYFVDGGPRGPEGIDLPGGGVTTIDIRVHGEALFLDSTNLAAATLRFDILAAADDQYGNADGDITLSELGQVPLTDLTDLGLHGRYVELKADVDTASPKAALWTTLEDFVYLGLFPKVARFEDTGTCVTRWGRRH